MSSASSGGAEGSRQTPLAGVETICTHFAEEPIAQGGGASPPIHQSSTFMFPNAEAFETGRGMGPPQYEYTRVANPTTHILEQKLAALEHGTWARCFGSGMGAIVTAVGACLHAGAHAVVVGQCYGPTRTLMSHYLNRFGVETTYVHSVRSEDFLKAIRPNTRLMYLESPTTGYMEIPEIDPIARACRQRGVTTIFDNSWASPYFQQPLDFGVDLVVHSATKYIGGHSDVVAGAVIGRDDGLRRRVAAEGELLGATLDPFAAWLLIRGLRTLPVRMEQHQRSALALARLLESHPRVARVNHPGLESHPQHAVARRQLSGYSSLFSFQLTENSREATYRVMNRLRLFGIGVSWGGYESLVVGGSLFGHDPQRPDWIIRLYVGLESTDDLLADLSQALEA
ncbi:MAG: L-methionine gamma-lyase [Phycisphaerae bacterium]|nr:L-methionine gamma-lyase [Phycisphaerae bacterium]